MEKMMLTQFVRLYKYLQICGYVIAGIFSVLYIVKVHMLTSSSKEDISLLSLFLQYEFAVIIIAGVIAETFDFLGQKTQQEIEELG